MISDLHEGVKICLCLCLFFFLFYFILFLFFLQVDRDISFRKRDLLGVIQQYSRFVKPAFDQYIRPTIAKADVIIPRGGDNTGMFPFSFENLTRSNLSYHGKQWPST